MFTIRGWLKDEQKVFGFADIDDSGDGMERKNATTTNDPEVDMAMFQLLMKERSSW